MVDMPNGSPSDPTYTIENRDITKLSAEELRRHFEEAVDLRGETLSRATVAYVKLEVAEMEALTNTLRGNASKQWQALRRLNPKLRRVAMEILVHGMSSVSVQMIYGEANGREERAREFVQEILEKAKKLKREGEK